jgi:hypothetical protein
VTLQAPPRTRSRELVRFAKFWGLAVLTEIKNRGTADVCIVVCDGLKGLPEAVNAVWDRAIIQTCVIHLLRNTFRCDHASTGTRSPREAGGAALGDDATVCPVCIAAVRAGYPEVHYLTSPLRSASVRAGDPHATNIWAGTGFQKITASPSPRS